MSEELRDAWRLRANSYRWRADNPHLLADGPIMQPVHRARADAMADALQVLDGAGNLQLAATVLLARARTHVVSTAGPFFGADSEQEREYQLALTYQRCAREIDSDLPIVQPTFE